MYKGRCKMHTEKITLCGDNCLKCPRYLSKTDKELQRTAEIWYKVGWRDSIVSNEEIQCKGCSSHKTCTYKLVECVMEKGVEKCNQCREFPCKKIEEMLKRSAFYREKCRHVCTNEEFRLMEEAFFRKEENLKK